MKLIKFLCEALSNIGFIMLMYIAIDIQLSGKVIEVPGWPVAILAGIGAIMSLIEIGKDFIK